MLDTDWVDLDTALGPQRAFPSRETGGHAPGNPEAWERLYLRIAQFEPGNPREPIAGDATAFLWEAALNALCALAEERHYCDRVVAMVRSDEEAITQALGKALGYPEAYPQVSQVDDGGVVTGPHVAATIAAEAAETLGARREAVARLEAELDRWRTWHVENREARLAQPPSRNVVVAFQGFDLGTIEEDIQARVGMPAPPDYATRMIGEPIHVALSATLHGPDEYHHAQEIWYGALVTFATTALQGDPPSPGPRRAEVAAVGDGFDADRAKYDPSDDRHPDHPDFVPFD